MAGFLTTHVLDTARGMPAAGLAIDLNSLEGEARHLIGSTITNSDGRTDAPILSRDAFTLGPYELVFYAGNYLKDTGQFDPETAFLDVIPIRFQISQDAHYHVPLLLSPFGYSTYRGS